MGSIIGQFGTADNLAPWTIWYRGQFGTGQFGTKIIKRTIWQQDNKSGQLGTRTILHQENLALDNLALGQFGTKHFI